MKTVLLLLQFAITFSVAFYFISKSNFYFRLSLIDAVSFGSNHLMKSFNQCRRQSTKWQCQLHLSPGQEHMFHLCSTLINPALLAPGVLFGAPSPQAAPMTLGNWGPPTAVLNYMEIHTRFVPLTHRTPNRIPHRVIHLATKKKRRQTTEGKVRLEGLGIPLKSLFPALNTI